MGKNKDKTKVIRVVLLGSSGCGKTSLCSRFVNNSFDYIYAPTREYTSFRKTINLTQEEEEHKQYVLLQIDDIFPTDDPELAQREFNEEAKAKADMFDLILENKRSETRDKTEKGIYRESPIMAYIYVFESNNMQSLDQIMSVMDYIKLREEKEAGRKRTPPAAKVFVETKIDIKPEKPDKAIESKIQECIRKYKVVHKQVSAVDNMGITELFYDIARQAGDFTDENEGEDEDEEEGGGFWAFCCGSRQKEGEEGGSNCRIF